jgi:hypothetical protein
MLTPQIPTWLMLTLGGALWLLVGLLVAIPVGHRLRYRRRLDTRIARPHS